MKEKPVQLYIGSDSEVGIESGDCDTGYEADIERPALPEQIDNDDP